MAAANSLLDALWVPGKIVIHYERTELQVYALSGGFGRNQNRGTVTELLNQCRLHVGGTGTGHRVCSAMPFHPSFVGACGSLVCIGPVDENDLVAVAVCGEKLKEIPLRAPRFREDNGFARGTQSHCLFKCDLKSFHQCIALCIH